MKGIAHGNCRDPLNFPVIKKKNRLRSLLVFLLLLAAQLLHSQKLTIAVKDMPLEKVFQTIQEQSQYEFVYTLELLKSSRPVTLNIKNASLLATLNEVFAAQPLTFQLEGKYVLIKRKEATTTQQGFNLRGKVVSETGSPIVGATVAVMDASRSAVTNDNGDFTLNNINGNARLIITSVGYYGQELAVNGQPFVIATLRVRTTALDETVVIAYGTTTRRLNTGSVSRVASAEIERQPVANPLAALQGRVAGLVISQSSGVPGATVKVQIRGRNSIAQNSDPLFIIDGVPFAPNNAALGNTASAFAYNGNGLSPFSTINPSDIESIEVLKDADATAIYGSRGANGVVLITTKKGKVGTNNVNANLYFGNSTVTRTMNFLDTKQYLAMRHEAFNNDGVVPDASNAPDLLVWDTSRYTNFKKQLIGGTAKMLNASVSLSGGTAQLRYLVSGTYFRETTVFPGDMANSRGAVHLNLASQPPTSRLGFNLSVNYTAGVNRIIASDITYYVNSVPNLPAVYDANGNLNWQEGGVFFDNPFAYLKQKYTGKTDNLVSNLQLNYKLATNLRWKINLGFNRFALNEVSTFPQSSQNPLYGMSGSAQFSDNTFHSWIVEPQLDYSKKIAKGQLQLLLGGTAQQTHNESILSYGTGYANDLLLGSVNGASSVFSNSSVKQYKYVAAFGRINYNWDGKYVLNLSGRRDGSSRFGPGKQFANFGSIGALWIFTNEKFLSKQTFLSFGKIRGSYGLTGNDQIGDYQYLDTWSNTTNPYSGSRGLRPSRLFNPNYAWELNRKVELAFELGFLKDRITTTIAYFRNRSGNQLLSYKLPTQTGFTSVFTNFPAEVQNKGFEFELAATPIRTTKFVWEIGLNGSFIRNKLRSFPGLATSSYSTLTVGQPLSTYNGFRLLGVDTQTGIYQFMDSTGKPTSYPLYPSDLQKNIGNLDPSFFGGFQNDICFKGWQLAFLLEYKQQQGFSYLYQLSNAGIVPGSMYNQPTIVLNRWQKPGDKTEIQRFTTTPGDPAYDVASVFSYVNVDAQYTDASYLRLKNISLSYNLSDKVLKKLHWQVLRLYVLGQNLLTITSYKGNDPETQNLFALPTLKTWAAGLQITF
ncbi:MAG: SusC/RagA family TonB-linked outer membrane protein [Williamsia sp.]|nr:SusC/RagA family TonB-linked outer membrane protein [Williamsia sp.]